PLGDAVARLDATFEAALELDAQRTQRTASLDELGELALRSSIAGRVDREMRVVAQLVAHLCHAALRAPLLQALREPVGRGLRVVEHDRGARTRSAAVRVDHDESLRRALEPLHAAHGHAQGAERDAR